MSAPASWRIEYMRVPMDEGFAQRSDAVAAVFDPAWCVPLETCRDLQRLDAETAGWAGFVSGAIEIIPVAALPDKPTPSLVAPRDRTPSSQAVAPPRADHEDTR